MVSSGDYQRYYTVDGVTYCHIIDPDTLMPPTLWRAVTVLCPDSGKADALSTALFCLSREEGEALLERFGARSALDSPGRLDGVYAGLRGADRRIRKLVRKADKRSLSPRKAEAAGEARGVRRPQGRAKSTGWT